MDFTRIAVDSTSCGRGTVHSGPSHSGGPGCRHGGRRQAIEEILRADSNLDDTDVPEPSGSPPKLFGRVSFDEIHRPGSMCGVSR